MASLGSPVAMTAALAAGLAFASPAAAQGPPDFSGVWTYYAPPGVNPFRLPPGPPLPFTPAAQKQVDEYNALVAPKAENPSGYCLGTGMPGSMMGSGPYPMEIIQTPGKIVIIYEAHSETRRVYMNDDYPEGDKLAGRGGYSKGHWDGNILVVETDHLVEQVDQRWAHGPDARIVERYHLDSAPDGAKLLVAEWTITDPGFYAGPVSDVKKWAYVPNGRLLDYDCNETAWNDHIAALRAQAASKGGK